MNVSFAEYKTWRCDHCNGRKKKEKDGVFRPKKQKPIYKRISDEKLYELVRNEILEISKTKTFFVTAEKIAEKFQVKKHRVKHVFMKLNQEGILSRGENKPPHDSRRSIWPGGGDNSWQATIYYIRKDKINE